MKILESSERHAIVFHVAFTAFTLAVLAAPMPSMGLRVWALVVAYNVLLPLTARRFDHQEWMALWLFLVPLSALQVLPDAFLASILGSLVFPDIGGPRLGPVNASMAGMWTMALFPVLLLGRRVEERHSRKAAFLTVAAASFIIFVGSEAVSWRIPLWYAQDVKMVGHVALYVVVPEVLLGLATYRAFEATLERPLVARLIAALGLAAGYLGALIVSYLLIETLIP